MPKRKPGVTFEDVCQLGDELPGVEQSTSYGTRALKVKKRLFARMKEDGETLVLKMDMVSRPSLPIQRIRCHHAE